MNKSLFNYALNDKKKESNVFLMAEDNPIDAELFKEMLNAAFDGNYSIVCVNCFEEIIEALENDKYHALILDMELPDRSGPDNVYQLGKQYPTLPIVVLTGNEDLNLAINSLQNGAQDYLSKNSVTPEALARSVHYAKERKHIEQRLKRALEDAAFKNIQLEAQAKHDPLTGIANRSYFNDVSNQIIHRAKRGKLKTALLYFDLNDFKKVNDTYGHLVGDELLKKVSTRLKNVVRESDFLARIGGDEFVIITDTIKDKREVYPLVKRLQDEFDNKIQVGTHVITVSASIGIAFYPEADNLDLLIKQADCAMYEAKGNRSAAACFFSDKMASQYARTQKIELSLSSAVERSEFTANFQPLECVDKPSEIHIEALARWHSSSLGTVPPDEFISIAENTPVINGITQITTQECVELYGLLQKNRESIGKISINVCAQQLANQAFCAQFLEWLEEYSLPKDKICLELTERQFVQNIKACKKQINYLKSQGVSFALDDFGSGFSSITHLLDLPFDILKLDRILISYLDNNNRNQALVAGIVEMAHRLEMLVVAEGVERQEERSKCIDLGCDYLQGFLISKSLPLHETALFYQ